MNKWVKSTALALSLVFTLGLAGCGGSQTAKPANDKPLKIGVTAGPHAEILDAVKKVAEKDGLKIEVVEFNDYIQPNVALNQGDINLNSFQHQPYLDNIITDRKFEIVSLAKTVIFPMGIYSKKVKNIADLQPGATIAILTTVINNRQVFHLAQLAELFNVTSLAANQFINQGQKLFIHAGSIAPAAHLKALVLTSNVVSQQSFVFAFDDAFLVLALLCFVGVLPSILLRPVKKDRSRAAPVMME